MRMRYGVLALPRPSPRHTLSENGDNIEQKQQHTMMQQTFHEPVLRELVLPSTPAP